MLSVLHSSISLTVSPSASGSSAADRRLCEGSRPRREGRADAMHFGGEHTYKQAYGRIARTTPRRAVEMMWRVGGVGGGKVEESRYGNAERW